MTRAGLATVGAVGGGCMNAAGPLDPLEDAVEGLTSPDNFINVQQYATDDRHNGQPDWTAAITAAIEAAQPGSVIYFPPGEYGVAGIPATMCFRHGIRLKSNLTLLGAGAASRIVAIGNEPQRIFQEYHERRLDNVRITNLWFQGRPTLTCDEIDMDWGSQSGAAIILYWFSHITIDHCTFQNFPLGAFGGAGKGNDHNPDYQEEGRTRSEMLEIFKNCLPAQPGTTAPKYLDGNSYGLNFHNNHVFSDAPHVTTTGVQAHRLRGANVTHNLFERCSRAFTMEIDASFETTNQVCELGPNFEYRTRDIVFANNVCRNGAIDPRRSAAMTVTSCHLSIDTQPDPSKGIPPLRLQNVTIADNVFEGNDNTNTQNRCPLDQNCDGVVDDVFDNETGEYLPGDAANNIPPGDGIPDEPKPQQQGVEVMVRGYLATHPSAGGVAILRNVFRGYTPRGVHDEGIISLWAIEGGSVVGNVIQDTANSPHTMQQAIRLLDTRLVSVTGNVIDGTGYVHALAEVGSQSQRNLYFGNVSSLPFNLSNLSTSQSIALQSNVSGQLNLRVGSYTGKWTASGIDMP